MCNGVKLAYVTLKQKILFQEENERKPLGTLLFQGVLVTAQGQLDGRDDFLGILAHLGFGEEGFRQPGALVQALTRDMTSAMLH